MHILSSGTGVRVGISPLGGSIASIKHQGRELVFSDDKVISGLDALKDQARAEIEWGQIQFGQIQFALGPQANPFYGPKGNLVPPPTLHFGKYSLEEKGAGRVVLTSPRCNDTGQQITHEVQVTDSGVIYNRGKVTNLSDHEVKAYPWFIGRFKLPANLLLLSDVISSHGFVDKGLSALPDEFKTGIFSYQNIYLPEGEGWHKEAFSFSSSKVKARIFWSQMDTSLEMSFPNDSERFPLELCLGDQYVEVEAVGPLQTLNPEESTDELVVRMEFRPFR